MSCLDLHHRQREIDIEAVVEESSLKEDVNEGVEQMPDEEDTRAFRCLGRQDVKRSKVSNDRDRPKGEKGDNRNRVDYWRGHDRIVRS
jgi:hypothetical protein